MTTTATTTTVTAASESSSLSPSPRVDPTTLILSPHSSLPLLSPPIPPPPQQQQQATPPSSNPRRLPPPCWSFEETVALIDAYREKWYSLRRGNLKANHWQDVADVVVAKCPAVSPPKTAVQCRHKMEKLRKRYRTEIQRGKALPVSRWSSSWVHFRRMDAMEKGTPYHELKGPEFDSVVVRSVIDNNHNNNNSNDKNSDREVVDSDNDDFNDDDGEGDSNNGVFVDHSTSVGIRNRNGNNMGGHYPGIYKNANEVFSARNLQKLYRNGIASAAVTAAMPVRGVPMPPSGGGGGGDGGGVGGGFRIRIPTGVSIAQPAPPKFYAKADLRYGGGGGGGGNINFVPNLSSMRPNFGAGGIGGGGGDSSRGLRVDEEMGKKREREPIEEMVAAIKVLGDGFVRIEQMKMEMAREIEAMRMEMEMKRTEMILDSQQRIVEAFARAFAEKKKKPKRMPSSPKP